MSPSASGTRRDRRSIAQPRQLGAGVIVGIAALVLTRWPMALPLGFAAVFALRGLGAGDAKDNIARLEAIATWAEMLRDTLAAASGLSQAIVTTAASAPRPIRPHIELLASRLRSGVPADEALIEAANDLADPAADMIIAALVMASTERAQRLGDLLGALASAGREEVAMRLGIEASRASARSAVRMITGFSLGLFALMALFARSYLAPYRSDSGQLMLGVVGIVFGLGLWLMSVMARTQPFPRLELTGPRR